MSVYTPEILRLATETVGWPRLERPDASGEARAPVCGSRISLDLGLAGGRIVAIGMDVRACALGQASASLFARSASGASRDDIASARAGFADWLAHLRDDCGTWDDFRILEGARALTARHGAMLLPFDAAMTAFTSVDGAP